MNIGIIGVGGRGNSFIGLIKKRDDVFVTALCDPNHVRMRKTAEGIKGEQKLYADVDDMLASEDMDAVIITSPWPDCTAGSFTTTGRKLSVWI